MHVLVEKILIIKFSAVIIDKLLLEAKFGDDLQQNPDFSSNFEFCCMLIFPKSWSI